jgi:uncharacterized protein
MKNLLAFVFGSLFSIGLMISGMSNPEKVLNFLDLFGTWDASLAFVMMGAICVAFIPFQIAVRRTTAKTILNEPIQLPQNNQIDQKLIFGAVLFGVGWGIAGICPAPSLTLSGLGHFQAVYFIVAMLIGVILHDHFFVKYRRR